jgi:hypothetical protein
MHLEDYIEFELMPAAQRANRKTGNSDHRFIIRVRHL